MLRLGALGRGSVSRNSRHRLQVVAAHALGVERQLVGRLHVLELDQALEREMHLGLVEDVEQDDLVAAVAQVVQALQHRLRVGQQVAEEHDQALAADHGRQLVQARGHVGLRRSASGWPAATGCCRAACRLLRGGRLAWMLRVERDQADRVLLVDHQVAQRRRQADGVLELGQLLAVGVGHRGAEVHHQVAGDVGLGLELLEVILVGLGVDVPVEVLEVVAGDVLAMLGELDGEALERAGVQAGQEALDDELGAQVEPGDLADDLGPQVLLGVGS